VKKYYYETHNHLKEHLQAFLMAYNFAKRLKTLKGLTPYEYICKCWQKEPERFTVNPCHHTLGLNTYRLLVSFSVKFPLLICWLLKQHSSIRFHLYSFPSPGSSVHFAGGRLFMVHRGRYATLIF
jgi:hypothetical protein